MDLDHQPTLVNEARASLSIDDVYIPVNTALAGFNRQTLGIDFPYIMPNGKAASEQDSHRQRAYVLRPGRRSLPVAFFGPHLYRVG